LKLGRNLELIDDGFVTATRQVARAPLRVALQPHVTKCAAVFQRI
jgi:hypothetical protein